jgi:hypothetical protein
MINHRGRSADGFLGSCLRVGGGVGWGADRSAQLRIGIG